MRRIPERYRAWFKAELVDCEPIVMTSVGPRASLCSRWRCRVCGHLIKPNNAGAASHVAKHTKGH